MSEVKKRILSFIGGVVTTFFQIYGPILILVCVVIIFDTVTGCAASKAKGVAISSKKANKGFWKKVGLLLALFFGVFLDVFIPVALQYLTISLPFKMPFGLIFGCYIVFNEAISIAENIDVINPEILPKWVKALLKSGVDKIDSAVLKEEGDGKDVEQ